jgi:dienelactone hydrolase
MPTPKSLSRLFLLILPTLAAFAAPLPNTQPLTTQGDLASQMVDGIDRFLTRETERTLQTRAQFWHRDFSSPAACAESIRPNREHLAKIVGLTDPREHPAALEFLSTTAHPSLLARTQSFEVHVVRWSALRRPDAQVDSEGLLLIPTRDAPMADVIAIPDADQTPEQLIGLTPGIPVESQFPRRLAESGCRVLIPTLISRSATFSITQAGIRTNQPHREFIYRPAYEMGRHPIGYELQKILSVVDFLTHDREAAHRQTKIGVIGYAEGGLLALYAAALDPRIDAACVSGYFAPRENLYGEPIYRNLYALLTEFGDAELASMVLPRPLIIEAAATPKIGGPPLPQPGTRAGAAPGKIATATLDAVRAEIDRVKPLVPNPQSLQLIPSNDGTGPSGSARALQALLSDLSRDAKLSDPAAPPQRLHPPEDPDARQHRLIDQMQSFTQSIVRESPYTRQSFWSKADRKSRSPEKWQVSTTFYRDYLANEVIGRFDHPLLPPNPRTREIYNTPKFTGYEVLLDVFPDVFAYGILLLPKDLKPNERRPVVVCQHGLEGRPQDVADPNTDSHFYHHFAATLADQGFITYAPQNPYIFQDRFRTLQRKLNPLKKTLFSIIIPQHQQTTDWLASQPFVDPDRIAFYGLSYGGKTAMRVPPLVPRYCLSICSGDFNEWIWKNTSLRSPYSYVGTGEYEMFEWDLGNTFNYAELAALIAPRPFMVERGHRDGVAPDEWVAYEYAKVRQLYVDLNIPDRTTIEFFDGPHTIHGVGTYQFLHDQLRFPAPSSPSPSRRGPG